MQLLDHYCCITGGELTGYTVQRGFFAKEIVLRKKLSNMVTNITCFCKKKKKNFFMLHVWFHRKCHVMAVLAVLLMVLLQSRPQTASYTNTSVPSGAAGNSQPQLSGAGVSIASKESSRIMENQIAELNRQHAEAQQRLQSLLELQKRQHDQLQMLQDEDGGKGDRAAQSAAKPHLGQVRGKCGTRWWNTWSKTSLTGIGPFPNPFI